MDPDSKAKISMLPTKMMFIDIDFELLYLLEGDHSFECSNSMNFLYDECVDNEAVSEQLKKYGCKAPDTIIGQHHPTCDLSRWNQRLIYSTVLSTRINGFYKAKHRSYSNCIR